VHCKAYLALKSLPAESPGACCFCIKHICCALRCHFLAGSQKTNVSVVCCTTGSSYAKLASSTSKPTCFQHTRPGATGEACAKPVNASGFFNQGPGLGNLFLVRNATKCSDDVQVGLVNVTCPEGVAANKVHFKIATPAIGPTAYR
jgi:hypothetical protein